MRMTYAQQEQQKVQLDFSVGAVPPPHPWLEVRRGGSLWLPRGVLDEF
jgi:hypothetical protein